MLLRKAGLVLGRADTGELVLESYLVISDGPIPSESTHQAAGCLAKRISERVQQVRPSTELNFSQFTHPLVT